MLCILTPRAAGSLEVKELVLTDAGRYHCHVSSHGKTKVSRDTDAQLVPRTNNITSNVKRRCRVNTPTVFSGDPYE